MMDWQELAFAEIELRLAAREYAECHADPSRGIDGPRAKQCAARLREAAEKYAATKFSQLEWKLSS